MRTTNKIVILNIVLIRTSKVPLEFSFRRVYLTRTSRATFVYNLKTDIGVAHWNFQSFNSQKIYDYPNSELFIFLQ